MAFDNGLTAAEAERLAILAEEAGEVVQAVGKILRHGYDSRHPDATRFDSNRNDLSKELGDLIGLVDLMVQARDLDQAPIMIRRRGKIQRLRTYAHHQPVELLNCALGEVL